MRRPAPRAQPFVEMAPCSRLILRPCSPSLLTRCPGCLRHRSNPSRTFSSTSTKYVLATAKSPTTKDFQGRMPHQRSKRVQMKEMPVSKISDDVGLLPETFIRPPNRDLPALFSDRWKSRLKLEWLWAKSRAQNLGSYVSHILSKYLSTFPSTNHLLSSRTVSSTSSAGTNANYFQPRECA